MHDRCHERTFVEREVQGLSFLPAEVHVCQPVMAELDVPERFFIGFCQRMGGIEREEEPWFIVQQLADTFRRAEKRVDGRFHVFHAHLQGVTPFHPAESGKVMFKPGSICHARGAFCRAPTGVEGEDMSSQILRDCNRTDRILYRDLCHLRVDRARVQVEDRCMHGDCGDLRMMLPAGDHLVHGKAAEPEVRGFEPVLDPVKAGP